MKKKVTSIILSAAMAASLLTVNAVPAMADEDPIKIGVSIWSSTDVLGSQCKKIIDAAADALGVEVQYVDQGHVSEKVTASVDQLCAAGCDGIIICNSADTEMTSAIATCNDNNVYLAQFFRIISDEANPDIYALAEASDYYVGAVHENEPENGEKLVNILLEKGCRNIGLIGWEQGDATWLGRWEGYQAGVDKWNEANPDDQAVLSEPVYANTSSDEGAKVTANFISTNYPDNMDALIVAGGGGDPLVGSIGEIEAEGLTGKIDVVSTDFLPDLDAQLESGGMFAESGGHYCDPLFAFMMVYNAIKGNESYLKPAGEFGKNLLFPYLYVASSEDYANYDKYFVQDTPYTDEELVAMAEMDYADLEAACSALSIEDVMARHGAGAAETEAE